MFKIRKINDNRYCASCKSTKDVYEFYAVTEWGDIKIHKSIPVCKKCIEELQKNIESDCRLLVETAIEEIKDEKIC